MNWAALDTATALAAGGAAVAVLVAGVILWLVFGRRNKATVGTPEAALALAEASLPGFTAVAVIVSADGRAALVSGKGGRLAVLAANGSHVATREIGWPAIRATAAGIIVEPSGRGTAIALTGVDALDVRRLAPT